MGYTKGQKAEDFIGEVFNNGKLKVVGIVKKYNEVLFKVTCTECSKDPELFPDGYFISRKGELKRGCLPCGCSKTYKWDATQCILRMKRSADNKKFIVHGFVEEYKGKNTKVSCECPVDGYKWVSTVHYIVNKKHGCHICPTTRSRKSQLEATNLCTSSCTEKGYNFLRFIDGYKNNKSRFEYFCPLHGVQNAEYSCFVNHKTGCPECRETGYNPNKPGSFYIVRWRKDDNRFIKFGITNREVEKRIKHQSLKTEYDYEILFKRRWDDGYVPLNLESLIKRNTEITRGVVNKQDFRDGFSETINEYQLDLLVDTVLKIPHGGGPTPLPQL